MLTKEKSLYQVKLILNYLSEEEYKLIPQETIDYIENNAEYDENIRINPSIPLENQNLDDKTYKMLERIIKETEEEKVNKIEKQQYNQRSKDSEWLTDKNNNNMEYINLVNLVELLKKENSKIPKAKELILEYKNIINEKEKEIATLKQNYQELCNSIEKIPNFIKRIFIRNNKTKKLIEGGKYYNG